MLYSISESLNINNAVLRINEKIIRKIQAASSMRCGAEMVGDFLKERSGRKMTRIKYISEN